MSAISSKGLLSGGSVQTTTTVDYSPYSTVKIDGIKIGSESLASLIENSIKECLAEEDKDGTLSKLITSLVLDKMFELSDMSEDELVETAVYKKISDKVSQRLSDIENRLSILESQMSRSRPLMEIYDSSPYNYSYTTSNSTTND